MMPRCSICGEWINASPCSMAHASIALRWAVREFWLDLCDTVKTKATP